MNKVIKLYEVGQKIRNNRNGQIFEIVEREILEEIKETIYKVSTEHNGQTLSVEMDGNKLNDMIKQGLEVL